MGQLFYPKTNMKIKKERDAHIQSKNPFGMLGFDLSSKMTKGCRRKQFRMVMFKRERKWCSFTTQKQSKHVKRERERETHILFRCNGVMFF